MYDSKDKRTSNSLVDFGNFGQKDKKWKSDSDAKQPPGRQPGGYYRLFFSPLISDKLTFACFTIY